MRSSIVLGRIAGIEVGLHYSWFIIAFIIVSSLAVRMGWPLAALTAAGFFGGLLLHELAHAFMARRRGVPVNSITLFALGGVSHAEKESPDARSEFWIAAVGPLTSAALGFLCLAAAMGLERSPGQAALSWLGSINVALALFNLVPGFPLDGGRILRAAVWGWTGSVDKATRAAAAGGQLFALGLIVLGLTRIGSGGLWTALIGLFLFQVSGASLLQLDLRRSLSRVPVRDVMRRDLPVVDEDEDLELFAAHAGRPVYLVQHHGVPAGLVTPPLVRRARREHRHAVREAMVGLDRVRPVSPDDSAWEAMERLSREHASALPVVEDGALAGAVSADDIIAAVRARRQL